MRFTCPSCSKAYRLAKDRLGPSGQAKIRCPNCATIVRVRAGEGDQLLSQVSTSGAHQPAPARPESAAIRPATIQGAAAQASPPAAKPRQESARPRQATATAAADPAVWHVAVEKKAQGPFTRAKIAELLGSGTINATSLAWCKGQTGWQKIAEVPALAALLDTPAARPQRRTEPASPAARRGERPPAKPAPKPAPAEQPAASEPSAQAAASVRATVKSPAARSEGMLDEDSPTIARPGSADSQRPVAVVSTKPNRRPLIDQLQKGEVKASAGAQAPPEGFDDSSPTLEQDIPLTGPAAPVSRLGGRTAKPPDMTAGGRRKRTKGIKRTKRGAEAAAAKAAEAPAAAAPAAAAPPSTSRVQAEAQSESFFETGETFMADVDFALPDPNRHKPTKEEYNNLLQEFSVMFRLDKRSKRQKWGIAVVLVGLLVGVIAFGVILVVQGEQRKHLLRDSKTILAVFSLPYQTSVTVRMGGDDEDEDDDKADPSKASKAKATRSTSLLANQLRRKIQRKRVASVAKRGDGKANLVGGKGNYIQPSGGKKLSAADIRAQKAAAKRALEEALQRSHMGGRRERGVGGPKINTDVTTTQLRALCRTNMEKLYQCAQRHAGGASYIAVLSLTDAGRVGGVKALVEGAKNAAISSCAHRALGRVNYGVQSKARTHRCSVGG